MNHLQICTTRKGKKERSHPNCNPSDSWKIYSEPVFQMKNTDNLVLKSIASAACSKEARRHVGHAVYGVLQTGTNCRFSIVLNLFLCKQGIIFDASNQYFQNSILKPSKSCSKIFPEPVGLLLLLQDLLPSFRAKLAFRRTPFPAEPGHVHSAPKAHCDHHASWRLPAHVYLVTGADEILWHYTSCYISPSAQ